MGKDAAILRLQVLSQKAAPDAVPSSPLRLLSQKAAPDTAPKSPLSSRMLHSPDGSDTKIIPFGQMVGAKKFHHKMSRGTAKTDAKPSLSYSVKLLKRGLKDTGFGYVCGQTGCYPAHEVSI